MTIASTSKRILIAEAHDGVRRLLEQMLGQNPSYIVQSCGTVAEVDAWLEMYPIDLLIMDLGDEGVELVNGLGPWQKVILIPASSGTVVLTHPGTTQVAKGELGFLTTLRIEIIRRLSDA